MWDADALRRVKSKSRKKSQAKGLPFTTLVIAVALVVVFVGGLFYLVHNKKVRPLLTASFRLRISRVPVTGSRRSEERWRYIKELENREARYRSSITPTRRHRPTALIRMPN